MKILFCAPPHIGLLKNGGGVYQLMKLREQSLQERGHDIVYFSPWQRLEWADFDVCHLFMANGDSYNLGLQIQKYLPLVVSPIIDRIQPNILLRLSILIEKCLPMMYSHIGRCSELCQSANMLCLSSSKEERQIVKGLGVTSKRMIIHSPITLSPEHGEAGRLRPFSTKPFVLFIGEIGNPRKNIVRLIHAVAGLDIHLLIGGSIGSGAFAEQVRQLVQSSSNIHLVGFLSESEKTYAYAHAKAFVLPSLTESIGLAALEAAICGTTIVVTKNGGPPDYFHDNAYYVDPLSVKDIRAKILTALVAPKNCADHILNTCDLRVKGRELEQCYLITLGKFSEL